MLMARSVAVQLVCVLAIVSLVVPTPALAQSPVIDPAGEHDFKTKGFPSIAMLGGIALIAWAAFSGYSASGASDTRSSGARTFMSIQILIALAAVFFVFGPGHGGAGSGPAANVLGLLFFFSSSLGFYVHFTGDNNALLGWLILSVIELLGLLGMLPLLGLGTPITELNQAACLAYFKSVSIDRCDNAGYLQLLRTWGMFVIFGLVVGITHVLPRVQWTFSAAVAHGYTSAPSGPMTIGGGPVSGGAGAGSPSYQPAQYQPAAYAQPSPYTDKNYQPPAPAAARAGAAADSGPSFQSDSGQRAGDYAAI